MLTNPMVLKARQSVFTAKELMMLNELECMYVVDEDHRPIGVVTAHTATVENARKHVDKVMAPIMFTVHPDRPIQEAAQIFSRPNMARSHLPVADADGVMVGLISMKSLIGVSALPTEAPAYMSPELCAVRLATSRSDEEEVSLLDEIRSQGHRSAVTQVGAAAEKLGLKIRESSIVAAIAHSIIEESTSDKLALSYAIRDIILQMEVVNPGLGGGYKLGISRGEGRIAVAAFGRSGHALANSAEQLFLGSAVI